MWSNKFDVSDILDAAEHITDCATRIKMWDEILGMSQLPELLKQEIEHEWWGDLIKKHILDKYPKPVVEKKVRKAAVKKKVEKDQGK